MATARINGIDVRYTVTGSGPWVTLSHSLACRLEMWDEEVKRLSKRFTVLAYDSRGHGETSAPAMPYTLDMIADDIKGLYDHLGIRQSHWIGLSMGGVFGLAIQARSQVAAGAREQRDQHLPGGRRGDAASRRVALPQGSRHREVSYQAGEA